MLTPEQISLVRGSWEQVVPIADQAAELFYGKLFELDPSLKSMFTGHMTEQGQKFALSGALRLPEPLIPLIQKAVTQQAG